MFPQCEKPFGHDARIFRQDAAILFNSPVRRLHFPPNQDKFKAVADAKSVTRDDCTSAMGFVRATNKSNGIRSFIALAKADERVLIDHNLLNANANLLNLQNGTYDMAAGVFREHQRADLLTQIAQVSFDPDARCPGWENAMALICDPTSDLLRYVQQLLGYS